MRVIGGVFKGKNLKEIRSSGNISLRPTSARVKESIFNILKHRFQVNLKEMRILSQLAILK